MIEQNKYRIYISEQQIKILNAVELFMNKYPYLKKKGSKIFYESDAQSGAIDLVCELADIYCEYNRNTQK
jgi:hypothetical protein